MSLFQPTLPTFVRIFPTIASNKSELFVVCVLASSITGERTDSVGDAPFQHFDHLTARCVKTTLADKIFLRPQFDSMVP